MGQMIVEMGLIWGPTESLRSVFTWSLIFPYRLEHIADGLKKVMQTSGPTYGRADRLTNKRRSPREPLVGFPLVLGLSLSSRAYFRCFERMRNRPTDIPSDGQTKPHIEMLGQTIDMPPVFVIRKTNLSSPKQFPFVNMLLI